MIFLDNKKIGDIFFNIGSILTILYAFILVIGVTGLLKTEILYRFQTEIITILWITFYVSASMYFKYLEEAEKEKVDLPGNVDIES